jgi:hypothetical protein
VVLAAGLGAALFALHALWAPDLGAAVARLLNAGALALVAAFGAGGAAGLLAFLVGFVSLQVVGLAGLLLLEAGEGRLPGRGPLPDWAVGFLALVPLAALGGVYLGASPHARLLLLRRLLDLGFPGMLLGLPLLAAAAAMLVGALAAGRFGGGRLGSRRALVQLLVGAGAVLAVTAAAPLLVDVAASLAAAAARAPAADVRSAAQAVVPGLGLNLALLGAVVAALLLTAGPGRGYSPEVGLAGAPDLLPPRLVVIAEVAGRRLTAAAGRRGLALARAATARPGWATTLSWAVAILLVVLAAR